MLQSSSINTTFINPASIKQNSVVLLSSVATFLKWGKETSNLRKPQPHDNRKLTLVWFPQYQEQGLGIHSFQLWQDRTFQLQELAGTVPPHDRDWRHENLLLVSFKNSKERKTNLNKPTESDNEIQSASTVWPVLRVSFSCPNFLYDLGSFCTISNGISLEICGIKLTIPASKLFPHYLSLVSLAKHSHNI